MIAGFAQRLARDTKGVTVVEFALVLPIMVTALLGMIEVNSLVTAYGKSVSAAQSVADLTAQSASVVTSDLDGLAVAAQRILDPLTSSAAILGVDIVSVGFDANDVPYKAWSYHWGMAATAPSPAAAAGLGAANESVIMVGVNYSYIPLIAEIVPQITFSQQAVARPRVTRKIALNGVTG